MTPQWVPEQSRESMPTGRLKNDLSVYDRRVIRIVGRYAVANYLQFSFGFHKQPAFR